MECGTCRFCCWSFSVSDVPDPVSKLSFKPSREHCPYECAQGCSIHNQDGYPLSCAHFVCPYLQGKNIHRPDNFQIAIEELGATVGSFIPAVPNRIPVGAALSMIKDRRTIPAFILVDNEWNFVILSLDRDDQRAWIVKHRDVELWRSIFEKHGEHFDESIAAGTAMVA